MRCHFFTYCNGLRIFLGVTLFLFFLLPNIGIAAEGQDRTAQCCRIPDPITTGVFSCEPAAERTMDKASHCRNVRFGTLGLCANIPECPQYIRYRKSTGDLELPKPLQFDFTQEGLARGLGHIASWLLAFTGVLAFLMFVWGGRQWLMSGGDPEKVKSGVDTMKWAAIGTILAFASFILLTFLLNMFTAKTDVLGKPIPQTKQK